MATYSLLIKGAPRFARPALEKHITSATFVSYANGISHYVFDHDCPHSDMRTTLNKWFCEDMTLPFPNGSLLYWGVRETVNG